MKRSLNIILSIVFARKKPINIKDAMMAHQVEKCVVLGALMTYNGVEFNSNERSYSDFECSNVYHSRRGSLPKHFV